MNIYSPNSDDIFVEEMRQWIKNNPLTQSDFSNIIKCSPGNFREGTKHTKKTLRKMSKSAKGRKLSTEQKYKMSLAKLGKPQHPKTTKALIQANIKTYIVTTPDGVEITVTNLSSWCREKGLDSSKMCGVAKGRNSTHFSYKCRYP